LLRGVEEINARTHGTSACSAPVPQRSLEMDKKAPASEGGRYNGGYEYEY
jgi:hypothetical protein